MTAAAAARNAPRLPVNIKPEMIIALCALGLTLYQAWLTRRHNRLAVMPHLDWNRAKQRSDDGIEELAARCFKGKLPYHVRHHSLPGLGSIMSAGHEICVTEVFFQGLKRGDEPQVETLLRPVVFAVVYESFYRERFRFTTAERKLRDGPSV